MKLAIFYAFPHEAAFILKRFGCLRKIGGRPFPVGGAPRGGHEILAIQAGMGSRNKDIFESVVREFGPGLVMSVGFGGALYPGAERGELLWAERIFLVSQSAGPTELSPGLPAVSPAHDRAIGEILSEKVGIRAGAFFTLGRRMRKSELRKSLPEGARYPVCDMETYYLALACKKKGLPFLAIRSITDRLDEEIPAELFEVADSTGIYSLWRSLRVIVSNPGLLPDVFKLARASRIASRNLGLAVSELTRLL